MNIWVAGKPFIERWLRDQMGPKAFFKHMRENIPFIIEDLPYMPRLLNDVLSRLKDPKVPTLMPVDSPAHDRGFLRGVSLGVFLAMTLVLGLHYGQWLQQNELMMFVMGAAVTGGCLALIKPSSRSKKWD